MNWNRACLYGFFSASCDVQWLASTRRNRRLWLANRVSVNSSAFFSLVDEPIPRVTTDQRLAARREESGGTNHREDKNIRLNLIDLNIDDLNYSVFWMDFSGPVFSFLFSIKIPHLTEFKHPNYSEFRIENHGLKFKVLTLTVLKHNFARSWLEQMTLHHYFHAIIKF